MKSIYTLFLGIFLAVACTPAEPQNTNNPQPQVSKAIAVLAPLGNSGVTGNVIFEKTDEGIRVTAQILGLGDKAHGFHIHEYGDCTATDGTSAGGHFNPKGMEHSSPDAADRHMGDMGNVQGAGETNPSEYSYIDNTISIPEILGRGIIVHSGTDDFVTQPTGNAGGRIACGVIGVTK